MLLEVEVTKMLVSGDPWANWRGYQLPVSDDYICIWTPAGTRKHWKPRNWKPDFFLAEEHCLTYIWPDEWFTIHIFYNADNTFKLGYCDITLPAPVYTHQSTELIYTDLYIDVVINADGSVYTKDQDVYTRAAEKYPLVKQCEQKAYEVLDWLEAHAKTWTGPFAVMPHQLPRSVWDDLSVEEIRVAMLQGIG
jgi:protein associated with RNAse G/E